MDLDTIIFYVMSGIAALAGTSAGIGGVCAWLKKAISKVIEKLIGSKTDFDVEVDKLQTATEHLEKASEMFLAVGNSLQEIGAELRNNEVKNTEFAKKLDAMMQVLAIIVQNNDYLVANGEAKHCLDLLYGKQDSVDVEGVVVNE